MLKQLSGKLTSTKIDVIWQKHRFIMLTLKYNELALLY